MQSTENKIYIKIKYGGKGKIYFSTDFVKYGTPESVTKALNTLCNKKTLIRISRGIYLYPKYSELLNDYAYPSIDEIAKEIAKREKARLIPTGVYALNALGLSTQMPMRVVFLTDGTPRIINIEGKASIKFKKTIPKYLALRGKIMTLVIFALKEIGQKQVSEAHLSKIKEALKQEKKENIEHDIKLAPEWIANTLIKRMNND